MCNYAGCSFTEWWAWRSFQPMQSKLSILHGWSDASLKLIKMRNLAVHAYMQQGTTLAKPNIKYMKTVLDKLWAGPC